MTRQLLTVSLLLLATAGYAQGPPVGGPGPTAAAVPLDGGSALLLAAGVGYGLRRLQQRRVARS